MREIYRISVLIGFMMLFCTSACRLSFGEYNFSIHSINNADFDIGMEINFNSVDFSFTYPDTSLVETRVTRLWEAIPIKKDEEVLTFEMGTSSWSKFFKQSVPSDTISFVVYDWEVLENTEWEEIRDNYMILKRYDLSLEDLQKLDFTLYYPPTEAMKDMRMYPP